MSLTFSRTVLAATAAFTVGAVVIGQPVRHAAAQSPVAVERSISDTQIAEMEARMQATRERLALTDQQSEVLRPILAGSFEQRMAVLQSYGFSQGIKPNLGFRQKLALRDNMTELREATNAEVNQILSADQMKEFHKIQDENRERLRSEIGGR
ncbi:MAG: hypothetical protein ACPH4G_08665 [Henriciella sp.]